MQETREKIEENRKGTETLSGFIKKRL